MPAIRKPLLVEAGSYEPWYWAIQDGATGGQIDLTEPGYSATLVVEDHAGTELLTLTDGEGLRLTADSRVYFEPSSTVTTDWPPMRAAYQIELSHPSGEDVRIGYGPFVVDRQFNKD